MACYLVILRQLVILILLVTLLCGRYGLHAETTNDAAIARRRHVIYGRRCCHLQRKFDNLVNFINVYHASVAHLQTAVTEMKAENSALASKVNGQHGVLNEQQDKEKCNYDSLKTHIESLNNDFQNLKQNTAIINKTVDQLTEENRKLRLEVAAVRNENANYNEDVIQLRLENAYLKGEIAKINQDSSERWVRYDFDIAHLKQESVDRWVDYDKQVANLREEDNNFKQMLAVLTPDVRRLQADGAYAKGEVATLKKMIKRLDGKLRDTRKDVQKNRDKDGIIHTKLQILDQMNLDLDKKCDDVKSGVSLLLGQVNTKIKDVITNVHHLENTVANLSATVQGVDNTGPQVKKYSLHLTEGANISSANRFKEQDEKRDSRVKLDSERAIRKLRKHLKTLTSDVGKMQVDQSKTTKTITELQHTLARALVDSKASIEVKRLSRLLRGHLSDADDNLAKLELRLAAVEGAVASDGGIQRHLAATPDTSNDFSRDRFVAFSAQTTVLFGHPNWYTAGEVVPFHYVLLNYGDHFNSSSGNFVCPVTGLYQFSVMMDSIPGQNVRASLYIGSNSKMSVHVQAPSPTVTMATNTAVLRCRRGDTARILADTTFGYTDLSFDTRRKNMFTVALVKAFN